MQGAACKNPKRGSRHQGKAKTTNTSFEPQKNHGQSILEAKSVDFSPFWCIKEPQQRRVETALPEWLQPFTEWSSTGSSCSTGVSPTDVAIPPPALPPSAHPPATPTSNTSGGNRNLFTHFPKDRIAKYAEARSYASAVQKKSWRSGGTEIKIAERFGDITADHEVFDEEQESRLHHKLCSGCGTLGDSLDSQLSMQNQIRRREVSEDSYVQKNTQGLFMLTIP